MKWMHPLTPITVGQYYWVLTPRGRRFIEQATTEEHFASGYVGCAIAGPIPEAEVLSVSDAPRGATLPLPWRGDE